jgi:hypothetical protein
MIKLRLTEDQFIRSVSLITEDKRGKKASEQTKQVIRDFFYNARWLDEVFQHEDNPRGYTRLMYMFWQFEENFFHSPVLRSSVVRRLEPAFARMAFEAGFQQAQYGAHDIPKQNRIKRIIWKMYFLQEIDEANMSEEEIARAKIERDKISKLPENISYREINELYGTQVDEDDRQETERINSTPYRRNASYTIIGPVNFETAHEYALKTGRWQLDTFTDKDEEKFNKEIEKYAEKNEIDWKKALELSDEERGKIYEELYEKWKADVATSTKICYAMFPSTWEDYTYEDNFDVYIALQDGWENLPSVHDDDTFSAYDTYGLSMIWVITDMDGNLSTSNTRWNHAGVYKRGRSVDWALTREEISEILGQNFITRFTEGRNQDGQEGEDEQNDIMVNPNEVKAECLQVIRRFFNGSSVRLDSVFDNPRANPHGLTIIEYIYWIFDKTCFGKRILRNSIAYKFEPTFLEAALECGFQQMNTPSDELNQRIFDINFVINNIAKASSRSQEEAEYIYNIPSTISFEELYDEFGANFYADEENYNNG